MVIRLRKNVQEVYEALSCEVDTLVCGKYQGPMLITSFIEVPSVARDPSTQMKITNTSVKHN
jgi:hypothetical protein